MKRIVITICALAAIGVLLAPAMSALARPTQAPTFANDAFARVWNRQDRAVFEGFSDRSWTWGPENLSDQMREPFREGPDGQRVVQYFDKSRMEINDPTADPASRFYVTNGLLPIEMMTGRMQTGLERFEQRGAARISAIGDPGNFPTYLDLLPLYQSPGNVQSDRLGEPVTSFLNANGSVTYDYDDYADDPNTVLVQGENGHGVAQAFVNFQNQRGLVFENNRYVTDQVFDPLFVFGLPVTEPYWVMSTVGGEETPIMFQVFERRVLTYNPANEPSFRVEMGNVGRHYYEWRYGSLPGEEATEEPAEEPTEEPTEEPYP
jgi:hypothetical protein